MLPLSSVNNTLNAGWNQGLQLYIYICDYNLQKLLDLFIQQTTWMPRRCGLCERCCLCLQATWRKEVADNWVQGKYENQDQPCAWAHRKCMHPTYSRSSHGRHPGGIACLSWRSKRNRSGRPKERAFHTQGIVRAKAWQSQRAWHVLGSEAQSSLEKYTRQLQFRVQFPN